MVKRKACKKCGSKDNGFYKNRSYRDGFSNTCKECERSANRSASKKRYVPKAEMIHQNHPVQGYHIPANMDVAELVRDVINEPHGPCKRWKRGDPGFAEVEAEILAQYG